MKRPFKVMMLLLPVLGACAINPGSSLPDLQESQVHPYQLDTGDELRVIVLDDPQLSGQFKVDGTGSISIPTVPRLEARGKSTAQLEQDLRTAIKEW